MKKLLAILISVFMIVTMLASCDLLGEDFVLNLPFIGGDNSGDNEPNLPEDPDSSEDSDDTEEPKDCEHYTTTTSGEKSPSCIAPGYTGDKICSECGEAVEAGSVIPAKGHTYSNGVCTSCGADDPDYTVQPDNGDSVTHIYNAFTSTEKKLFNEYFGFVIPFISNDEYYVEEYEFEGEIGLNFYAYDNTEEEFESYLAFFNSYTNDGTGIDDYGDTWYYFSSDDVYIDISYYYYENSYIVDVYVYLIDEAGGSGSDDTNNESTGNSTVDAWLENYECITVSEALALCEQFVSSPSSTRYYMVVTIDSIDDPKYGQLNVSDSTGTIMVYGTRSSDGKDLFGNLENKPSVGDTILIYGTLQNYKGNTKEVQNAWLIDFVGNDSSSDNGSSDNNNSSATHTYNDFTTDEKNLFNEYFGFVIPFIPNDEYYVEEYEFEGELGLNFYAFDNTEAEFEAYLALFNSYTNDGTGTDDYGDTWYYFSKHGFYVDLCYYYYENSYVVDVYVYLSDDNGGSGDSGSGDNGSSGDNSGSGGSTSSDNVITNDGAGLPAGSDGVYDVDFTKAENVKDVTDQGYYIDGCPTTGSPAVLVIPIQFSDVMASTKGYSIDAIENAFLKDGVTDYFSVYDYYYISSYGQLTLDITVIDSWFTPKYDSSYYADYYDADGYFMGDQLIMDEALAYLAGIMDLSKFDSDGNSVIDAVVLINSLDVGEDDFHWAYRYWNYYVDDDGYYYEYDGVSANDYLWASYQFLHESYDDNDNTTYDNVSGMDTYTYIHEFGHILGADDYYDTAYVGSPMNGCDIMDSMKGDHNAYTKFNFGWITTSRLVVADSSVTLTLEDFSKSGDTIIIANNWDPKLGAYQEYYVIMYYTNSDLNGGDNGYFTREGIVVYHINASLYSEEYDGEIYYDVYNNNTDASDQYGTEDNLIELVKSNNDTFTYVAGDTLPTLTLDNGDTLQYTFTVDSLVDGVATITFEKI